VLDVQVRPAAQEVEVFIEHDGAEGLSCPHCGPACGRCDRRHRPWRHLDTCRFRTTLTAEVPRVQCPEQGVLWLAVPRAERGIAR
jgi:transposase